MRKKKDEYRLILSLRMLVKFASVELDGGNVERVMGTRITALVRQAMSQSGVAPV